MSNGKKTVVKKEDESEGYQSNYLKMPLYGILFCGLLLSLIGGYLIISNRVGIGYSLPSKYGQGGGQQLTVNGQFTLLLGLIMTALPIYYLIGRSFKKKL